MTNTTGKSNGKMWGFAVLDTLIIITVMVSLVTGFINPVTVVLALLMPVWLVAGLTLWCSVL